MAINKRNTSDNDEAAAFFYVLLCSGMVAHILHLQADSYAKHMALGELYEGLPGLVDDLIEAYQGSYGIVMDYPRTDVPSSVDPLEFVEGLCDYIKANRADVAEDSNLQNIIDEIATLVDTTAYKLRRFP